MNDTIKPPAPFDAIPVGGPAAVLDIPRPLPTQPLPPQPRPAPRQAMPLPPPADAEPPKSPPVRPQPPAVATEPPANPAMPPAAEPNPLAGSPPPKASVFSGILWDLLRPNRAKVAVLAGVGSLAVGAFGLNLLFPTFGTAPPADQSKVKVKIPTEEPKPVAAKPPAAAPGGYVPIAQDPKPQPRVGETRPPATSDGLPPIDLGALPPLLPDGAKPVEDPYLRRTNGTGNPPTPPAAVPLTPGPLPVPSGPGGLPTIPSGPVMPDAGGPGPLPVLPGVSPAATPPKPAEPAPMTSSGLPPLPPGVGGPVAAEPVGLPPVGPHPFDDRKPVEVKPAEAKPLPPALPGVGGDPLPPVGALPLPGGLEVKPSPLPSATGHEVKPPPGGPAPLPLPPLPGAGEVKPVPLPADHGHNPAVKPLEVKPLQPEPHPFGSPPPAPARPGQLEPVSGTGAGAPAPPPPGVGLPTGGPAATLQPPVTEAKTDYDVDLHRPRAGDTYAIVSKAYYGGTQYAAALQAFNRNAPIDRIAEVQVPPVHVIRKFAAPRGGDPAPDRFTPTRPGPAGDDGPEWGAPGAVGTGQTVYTLFTVPRKGLTLRDVAKTYYGSERSWAKLNNSRNPKFDPDEELPVGTQLQIPTEPVNFR